MGTKDGGARTRDSNYKRHGKDFYKRIGAMGGKKKGKKGFALWDKETLREHSRKAGKKGGRPTLSDYELDFEDVPVGLSKPNRVKKGTRLIDE